MKRLSRTILQKPIKASINEAYDDSDYPNLNGATDLYNAVFNRKKNRYPNWITSKPYIYNVAGIKYKKEYIMACYDLIKSQRHLSNNSKDWAIGEMQYNGFIYRPKFNGTQKEYDMIIKEALLIHDEEYDNHLAKKAKATRQFIDFCEKFRLTEKHIDNTGVIIIAKDGQFLMIGNPEAVYSCVVWANDPKNAIEVRSTAYRRNSEFNPRNQMDYDKYNNDDDVDWE